MNNMDIAAAAITIIFILAIFIAYWLGSYHGYKDGVDDTIREIDRKITKYGG